MIVYSCPEPNLYSWHCTININWNRPTTLNDYHREMHMILYIWTIMASLTDFKWRFIWSHWQYSLTVIKDDSYIYNHKLIFLMLNTWRLEDLTFLKIKFKLLKRLAYTRQQCFLPYLVSFCFLPWPPNKSSFQIWLKNPSYRNFSLTKFHGHPFMSLTVMCNLYQLQPAYIIHILFAFYFQLGCSLFDFVKLPVFRQCCACVYVTVSMHVGVHMCVEWIKD